MKVVITKTASDSLWPVYLYHREYSQDYADQFSARDRPLHLREPARQSPAGHLYDEERGIRRLIFRRRFNIYYTVQEEAVFVLFIFDGRMGINSQLQEQEVGIEALLGSIDR